MLKLNELWEKSEEKNLDIFADKLLSKMKRNDMSVTFENGYIMPGSRGFIINDNFVKKSEAKDFIVKRCQC